MTRKKLSPAVPAVIGYVNGRPVRNIAGGAKLDASDLPTEPEEMKETFQTYTNEQLDELEETLVSEFDQLYGEDEGASADAESVTRMGTISAQVSEIRNLRNERKALAEERQETLNSLRNSVHGTNGSESAESFSSENSEDTEDDDSGDNESNENDENEGELVTTSSEDVAATFARELTEQVKKLVSAEDVVKANGDSAAGRDLNSHIRLSQVQQHAPDANVPAGRREAVITASADIPGYTQGGTLSSPYDLANAMHRRARNLPVSKGTGQRVPVASIERDFRFKMGADSDSDTIQDVLKAATDVDTLVAAGGWCAPSEISYDFYDIVCEDGLVDVPSVGVLNRGGIQFPVSPSFGDIIGASPDGLWTWTEGDDESAVDGTPTKDCVRVPCPTFNEERLVCEGFCLTVGNLVDFAYPELIQNQTRLLMAARAHLTNSRIIGIMEGASLNVDNTTIPGDTTAQLLNSIELQVADYREKFRMCGDAVLEVVLPRWSRSAIRADLANRNGLALFEVTDAMIADWFNLRGVRVQFVSDWQLEDIGSGAPATSYPTVLNYMLYAPGTFVRGQGLQLDLGVVRDSVLNETNDHTAAWMEDCYLIAQVGHESRLVTTNVCNAGSTGIADIDCVSS